MSEDPSHSGNSGGDPSSTSGKEISTSGKEYDETSTSGKDEMVWCLMPVQDSKSDQSNTAPKPITIPSDGCKLGRNPFTGVMDALVSRELLHIFFEGGELYAKALRSPNKATLNGELSFKDDLNKFVLNRGSVISLYNDKYRYTVSYVNKADAPAPSVGASAPSESRESSRKRSTAKVSPGVDSQRSRRSSERESAGDERAMAAQVAPSWVQKINIQWAFFFVVSGCLIAIVFIIARNTEDSKASKSSRRLLRGAGFGLE